MVQTKEIWTAALTGGTFSDPKTEPQEQGTPDALLARLQKVDVEFDRVLRDVRNRNAWGDSFVDALCEPPETFTFGGMIGLKDISKRATFVIDRGGIVRHAEVLDDARNEPNYAKVKQALASL